VSVRNDGDADIEIDDDNGVGLRLSVVGRRYLQEHRSMNPTELLPLAQQLVTLISPLIAQGALAKIGENTTDATQGLLKQTWDALKRRFAGNPKAEAALVIYQDEADDPKSQERLAQQIVACFQDNTAAINELSDLARQLTAQLGTPITPSRTHTANVSGNAQVGSLTVGDVHGGPTVGPIDFSKRTIVSAPGQTTPRPTQPAHPTPSGSRPALPATLSADGVHFTAGHALLIGVGQYARSGLSAPTTANDARQLAALLQDDAVAGFPSGQVQIISDGAATRQSILDALDAFAVQLVKAAQPTALVFFAGHGVQYGDAYALLPHDYDPANIAGSSIDAATFQAKVDAIRAHAQKLVVLLNCCHAGGVGERVLDANERAGMGAAPPPAFYQPLVAGSGQVLISSSRPAQKSGAISQTNGQHTTFGAQLLAALRGGAPGQGPGVGVFDLFAHLSAHVPADAQTITYLGKPLAQHPLLYAREVDQNFAVALRPNWHGGTLDTGLTDAIHRLAEIEITLALYAHDADAPQGLIAERDALLARVKG
jgi:uncharacterized caspase-like protein